MSRVQDARRYLARTLVRDALVAYRHRGLRPDDVFLASYPRAGSNWVKFLLLESITGRDLTFPESDEMMPYVGDHHSAPNVLPDGGRLLKTHEWYRQQYGRSIYLVRDPRDVVLSEYKYLAGRGKYTRGFDRFVEEFVGGTATGLGFWGDHVLSWLEADPAKVHVVRYEDLRADPAGGLAAMLDFLGISRSHEEIERAVENNTLQRMREKEDAARSSRANFQDLQDGYRFVNTGAVGGWQAELREEQVRALEARAAPILARLGYAARREMATR